MSPSTAGSERAGRAPQNETPKKPELDPGLVSVLEAVRLNAKMLLQLRDCIQIFLKEGIVENIDNNFDDSDDSNKEILKERFEYTRRIWESFVENLALYQIPEKSERQLRAIILIHSLGFSLNWEVFKKYESEISFLFYPTFTEDEFLTVWMMAYEINLLDRKAKEFRNMFIQEVSGNSESFNPPLSPEEGMLIFRLLTLSNEERLKILENDEIKTKFPGIYNYFNTNEINEQILPRIQEIISSKDINLLHRALMGDPTLTEEELKNPILYTFYPPLFDIKEMLNIVRNHDLESIIFGALKLMDKIKYPAKNEGFVKIWQDCMMMLHFYAPLLELAGFIDMANECNSVALDFLNRRILTEEEYSNLTDLHTRATKVYTQYNLAILGFLAGRYDGKRGLISEGIKVGDFLIKAISGRVKTIGSAGRKLWGKYRKLATIPDWLGFKVVIDEDHTPESLGQIIGYVI